MIVFAPKNLLPAHLAAAKAAIAKYGNSHSEVRFAMVVEDAFAAELGTRLGRACRTQLGCPGGHLIYVWSIEGAPVPAAIDCPLCP